MSEKIDKLLAVLKQAIKRLPHIKHNKNGDDAYCLISKAQAIAEELAKENND